MERPSHHCTGVKGVMGFMCVRMKSLCVYHYFCSTEFIIECDLHAPQESFTVTTILYMCVLACLYMCVKYVSDAGQNSTTAGPVVRLNSLSDETELEFLCLYMFQL